MREWFVGIVYPQPRLKFYFKIVPYYNWTNHDYCFYYFFWQAIIVPRLVWHSLRWSVWSMIWDEGNNDTIFEWLTECFKRLLRLTPRGLLALRLTPPFNLKERGLGLFQIALWLKVSTPHVIRSNIYLPHQESVWFSVKSNIIMMKNEMVERSECINGFIYRLKLRCKEKCMIHN